VTPDPATSPAPRAERRRSASGRLLRTRFGAVLRYLVPRVVSGFSRLVLLTCRFEFDGKEHEDRFLARGEHIIFAGLHEAMMLLPIHFRDRRGGVVMVSRSRDGDLIADTVERFGMRAVRGSSGRGGGEALHDMIEALRTTSVSAGVIVDGPRGPALEPKAGALVLARATGLPIVPGTWWSRPALRARSWDRTIVPLPFSRIVFAFSEALFVPHDARDDELEAYRLELERRLLDARVRAQRLTGWRGDGEPAALGAER
jgi:hypothetical protein